MPDFGIIASDPVIQSLVQENALQRAFHDSLFPALLYRLEAAEQQFPGNVGESMTFTGPGLIKPKPKPIQPGSDPAPSSYGAEQWAVTVNQYADTIDTHMPSSITAIADLFLRNAQQLGLNAGQTLNRLVRNAMYNAAMAGATVADGAQVLAGTSGTLRVARLNGFTTSRRPDLPSGSPVRFDPVSANNPLRITVRVGAVDLAASVVGFSPDAAGDEQGPGTLSLTYAAGPHNVLDRATVLAVDRTYRVNAAAANSIDALNAGDAISLAHIRTMVARFRKQNVAPQADGRYHCHLDPISEAQVFADTEFQRLLTSLPDHYAYREFTVGELLGTIFFRNSESPGLSTVENDGAGGYDTDEPFGGELVNAGGVEVSRALFSGDGSIYEYYVELDQLITEAGLQGKVGEPRITNSGIEVNTDRIQLIFRAPQNRLQDQVSTSWKFIGGWAVRTDAAVGDAARYKRLGLIEHAAE